MKKTFLIFCLATAAQALAIGYETESKPMPPGLRISHRDEAPAAVRAGADDFYASLSDKCPTLDMKKISIVPYFKKDTLAGYAISNGKPNLPGNQPAIEGTPFRNQDVIVDINGRSAIDHLDEVCNVLIGKDRKPVTVIRDEKRIALNLR